MSSISEWWMWLAFLSFTIVMIGIDLFIFGGGKAHRVSTKEALSWTIVWFALALIFNFILWLYLIPKVGLPAANEKSLEFFSGYLIEKSLSVDNIFIILMFFKYFAIPAEYQRRVLIYGVLGAIFMRLILILLGIWVVNKFHWILYIFGLLLFITGIKMLIFAEKEPEIDKNPVLKWLRNHLRVTPDLHQEHFFIRQQALWYCTPLFLVLILIEITDFIFAIDSIPAIFSVTNDPFIVFTSNIFAILGLRSLYFLLTNIDTKFHLLKYGIAIIIIFVGFKMLAAYWFTIPIFIALGVIIGIIMIAILLSIIAPSKWHQKHRK